MFGEGQIVAHDNSQGPQILDCLPSLAAQAWLAKRRTMRERTGPLLCDAGGTLSGSPSSDVLSSGLNLNVVGDVGPDHVGSPPGVA
jgi:hypothetical protein